MRHGMLPLPKGKKLENLTVMNFYFLCVVCNRKMPLAFLLEYNIGLLCPICSDQFLAMDDAYDEAIKKFTER